MKTRSVPLAVEAVLCAGVHTLFAPLLLLGVLVPMEPSGAVLSLVLFATSATALWGYWQLALATIESRAYRFGAMYWCSLGAAIAVFLLISSTGHRLPWLLFAIPPLLSGAHFSYLQFKRSEHIMGEAT